MIQISKILADYEHFVDNRLTNRFFKHIRVEKAIRHLSARFDVQELGKSIQNRAIYRVIWGEGKTKIMLWSQMHGDEATGTMALFDLIQFLEIDSPFTRHLYKNCQLLFIPMVNPDGAEIFTRRNAQQIDINRDFLTCHSTEARLLKTCRDQFEPEFGFNLHDQNTLWSVEGSNQPASLSFLAPAYDQQLAINEVRQKAMQVIAIIYQQLIPFLPQQIGLFDSEYEPRAFGDNFQKAGTSVILIEAGGNRNDDEKQVLRRYYFSSIIAGLQAICTKSYPSISLDDYFQIPANKKQIFHLLIHSIQLNGTSLSIGINYEEKIAEDFLSTEKTYRINDIGDLSTFNGYQVINAHEMDLHGEITLDEVANFQLLLNQQIIIAFKNGKLLQKH